MAIRIDPGMLKQTFQNWNADKAQRLAASLSYTTIFAIAPLLIIAIAIAGYVIGVANGTGHGHTLAETKLLGAIQSSAGTEAADTVRQMVSASFNKPRQSIIAQVIGWLTFILGAAGLFAALQDALNTVWHVEPVKRNLWETIRDRVMSLGMLGVIGFFLLVTTAANAIISFVSAHVTQALPFPGAGIVFAIVNWVVTIALVTLLFAMIFKFLPDAEIAWRDVWTGALFTAILFVIGQTLIALYIGRAGVASAYGAAGSLLVLLLWIYYSSMILLFGAEFTRVYAEKHGSRVAALEASPAPSTRLVA
jgi:membrane protein